MSTFSMPVPARIKSLQPYVCARHTCKGDGWVFLDANESPSALTSDLPSLAGINAYPDPTADDLRCAIGSFYDISKDQLIIGNGADELIDLTIRTFVRPKRSVLSVTPTYGMYRVCADISGVQYKEVSLEKDFTLNVDMLFANSSDSDVLFLCSPNNPTGNVIAPKVLRRLVERFNGLVVIDEAYGEFADAEDNPSAIELIKAEAKNLLILRTFSKAFGAAGLRLGYGIACTNVIEQLLKTKPPYNVNVLSQRMGLQLWGAREAMKSNVKQLLLERKRVESACADFGCTVYPSITNFFLMRLPSAISSRDVYECLKTESNIVVRDFGPKPLLENTLRISMGTPEQNDLLLSTLSPLFSCKK